MPLSAASVSVICQSGQVFDYTISVSARVRFRMRAEC